MPVTRPLQPARKRVEEACGGDMLCQFLLRWKIWQVTLLALLIYGVGVMGYGVLFTYWHRSSSTRFVGMDNPQEYILAFCVYCIYSPIVWSLYVWQPRLIADVFRQLEALPFVGSFIQMPTAIPPFSAASPLRKVLMNTLLGALMIGAIYIYRSAFAPNCPYNSQCAGRTPGWLELVPDFTNWIWLPLETLNVLFLFVILVRQVGVAYAFSRKFCTGALVLKPFDSDNCNGLAFVGTFTLASMAISLFIGLWLGFLTVYPAFYSGPPTNGPINWVYFTGFSLALPFFFVLPVWSVHRAMRHARIRQLEPISQELDRLFAVQQNKPQQLRNTNLLEYIQLYQSLDTAYVTLPFQRSNALGFVITAILPLLLGLVSLIMQLI